MMSECKPFSNINYYLGLFNIVIPVFTNEKSLVDAVSRLFEDNGYNVRREVYWNKHRFDLYVENGDNRIIIEAKNPRKSTNRVAGIAFNQLLSYLKSGRATMGLLILPHFTTSHILKYLPVLRESEFYKDLAGVELGVAVPIVEGGKTCLYSVVNRTTWAGGKCLVCGELDLETRNITLNMHQFFDYVVYSLWLQNKFEWLKIGLKGEYIDLLKKEAERRGYRIIDGSIREPWSLQASA